LNSYWLESTLNFREPQKLAFSRLEAGRKDELFPQDRASITRIGVHVGGVRDLIHDRLATGGRGV